MRALYEGLENAGIAFGPVRRLDQVLSDPHLLERRMSVEVEGVHRTQTFIRQPSVINGQVGEVHCQAPELGRHNAALLAREHTPFVV